MKRVETPHVDLKESGTSEPSFHCSCCNRTWDKRDPMARKYDLRINLPYKIMDEQIILENTYGLSFWNYRMCIDCLRIKTRFLIEVLTCLNKCITTNGVDWNVLPDALKSLPYKSKEEDVIPYD